LHPQHQDSNYYKMPAKKLTVTQAISQIMSVAHKVDKDGRNDFHNYDYSTEIALIQAVRQHMTELGVVITPTDIKTVGIRKGETVIDAVITFRVHGPEGDYIDVPILASGEDKGDKAAYKLMTGANKYAIQKIFQLPMGGDDPEATDERGKATVGARPNTPVMNAPQQVQQPAPPQNVPQQTQQPVPQQTPPFEVDANTIQLPHIDVNQPQEQVVTNFVDSAINSIRQLGDANSITSFMQDLKQHITASTQGNATLSSTLTQAYANEIVKQAGEKYRALVNPA
jgi:hypothetical protein